MSGAHIDELMMDLLYGELSAEQRRAAEKHLAECPECAREFAELKRTVETLKALPDPPLRPQLDRRIMDEARKVSAKRPIINFMLRPAVAFAASAIITITVLFATHSERKLEEDLSAAKEVALAPGGALLPEESPGTRADPLGLGPVAGTSVSGVAQGTTAGALEGATAEVAVAVGITAENQAAAAGDAAAGATVPAVALAEAPAREEKAEEEIEAPADKNKDISIAAVTLDDAEKVERKAAAEPAPAPPPPSAPAPAPAQKAASTAPADMDSSPKSAPAATTPPEPEKASPDADLEEAWAWEVRSAQEAPKSASKSASAPAIYDSEPAADRARAPEPAKKEPAKPAETLGGAGSTPPPATAPAPAAAAKPAPPAPAKTFSQLLAEAEAAKKEKGAAAALPLYEQALALAGYKKPAPGQAAPAGKCVKDLNRAANGAIACYRELKKDADAKALEDWLKITCPPPQ